MVGFIKGPGQDPVIFDLFKVVLVKLESKWVNLRSFWRVKGGLKNGLIFKNWSIWLIPLTVFWPFWPKWSKMINFWQRSNFWSFGQFDGLLCATFGHFCHFDIWSNWLILSNLVGRIWPKNLVKFARFGEIPPEAFFRPDLVQTPLDTRPISRKLPERHFDDPRPRFARSGSSPFAQGDFLDMGRVSKGIWTKSGRKKASGGKID